MNLACEIYSEDCPSMMGGSCQCEFSVGRTIGGAWVDAEPIELHFGSDR
jgi:hypothetical protein